MRTSRFERGKNENCTDWTGQWQRWRTFFTSIERMVFVTFALLVLFPSFISCLALSQIGTGIFTRISLTKDWTTNRTSRKKNGKRKRATGISMYLAHQFHSPAILAPKLKTETPLKQVPHNRHHSKHRKSISRPHDQHHHPHHQPRRHHEHPSSRIFQMATTLSSPA